jgi:hypothetical protein
MAPRNTTRCDATTTENWRIPIWGLWQFSGGIHDLLIVLTSWHRFQLGAGDNMVAIQIKPEWSPWPFVPSVALNDSKLCSFWTTGLACVSVKGIWPGFPNGMGFWSPFIKYVGGCRYIPLNGISFYLNFVYEDNIKLPRDRNGHDKATCFIPDPSCRLLFSIILGMFSMKVLWKNSKEMGCNWLTSCIISNRFRFARQDNDLYFAVVINMGLDQARMKCNLISSLIGPSLMV